MKPGGGTPLDSEATQPESTEVGTIDSITITGLSARGFHGVLPEERVQGQDFVADIEMLLDRFPEDDDLAGTVDYSAVADLVVATIESGPHQLIETLANEIAANILDSAPLAQSVRVTVHKPSAPIAHTFRDVAVTITRSR